MTVPRARRRREARLERRDASRPRWVVPMLAGVFLLSGSAGLVHEVVWARLLGRLFGATSLAVSTVLAAYMGGLAVGSYWIGKRLDRIRDRRRAYALLEIGIGLTALSVPLLLHLVEPAYGVLWRRFQFSFATFTALRFLIAVGLLSAPTVLMGATLPVLADYFAALGERRIAPQWLYTINLIGAVVGVAAAGFLVMPRLGLVGTILVGATINLLVGLVVLALPRLPEQQPREAARHPARAHRTPTLLLVAATVSGLTSLATQVVWTRVLVLIVGSSTYAFSAVLLVYLLALAAGSVWASGRGTRADVLPDLAVVHGLLGLFTLGAVHAVDRLPYWYAALFAWWAPASIPGTIALDVVILFALLILPVLAAGTVLPLALAGALPGEAADTGAVVGTVYALNTVGAIAGALLAGFVLLPTIGSQPTLLGAAALAALLGVMFALASSRRRTLGPVLATVAALVLAGGLLAPPWGQEALNAAVYDPIRASPEIVHPLEHVVFHREGRNATVAVIERKSVHALRINGRINASDNPLDMMTQILLAQVPLLLAPRTDEVFLVGWGSGITAGAVLQGPVRRLTAVELEPAVMDASDLFLHANHGARRDPRLRLYEDDARHLLRASEDTYDVIISEPSHPWVTGVADLFTRDFFALAASRLAPDGLFAQWLQGYQISEQTFHSILFSFASVFPHVLVFSPPHRADWILVGSRTPIRVDLADLDRRWTHEGMRTESARIGLARPEHFLAGLALGPERVVELTRQGQLNTDDNMFVEFHAPADVLIASGARAIAGFVDRYATPVESVLVDPDVLLRDPDRLGALIEALARQGSATDRYRKMLAGLPERGARSPALSPTSP